MVLPLPAQPSPVIPRYTFGFIVLILQKRLFWRNPGKAFFIIGFYFGYEDE